MSGILSLLIGREIGGRYRIDAVIGRGGMGAVCSAIDTRLKRAVAIKVFTSLTEDNERDRLQSRWEAEARAVARLHHPNVVTVHDFGLDPTLVIFYLVMELLNGEDLRDRMRRAEGPLPVDEALMILRQAAAGLAAGHRAGIVHGDVKPGNIYLNRDASGWQVKVLDYGVAPFASDASNPTVTPLTKLRAPFTPRYASPEQLRGHVPLPASDVYSLALTAVEMLGGEPFGRVDTPRNDVASDSAIEKMLAVSPDLPSGIAAVFRRALRTDPSRRFSDADALLSALARGEAGETDEPTDRRPVQAGYATDSLLGSDQLEIAADVEALCSVLAAREVKPPLAVGLFGDWGTGKSFFMKAMEKRIDSVAKASQAAEERVRTSDASTGENPSGYCAHIVQVWFNAWHYMDSNLWASLAAHVFQRLADYLENDDRRETLFAGLETSRGMLAEVVAEKRAAERRLMEISHQRKELEKNLTRTAGAAFRAAVAKLRSDPEVQQTLQRVAVGLHLPDLEVGLERIEDHVQEFHGWSARLRVVFRNPLHAVVVLAVFAATTGLTLWAADRLTGWTLLVRALAAAATGLAAFSGVLAPLIARVSRAVSWLEDVHRRVRNQKEVEEGRQRQAEIAGQRELLRLEAVEREAAAHVREVESEIAEMRAGRQLQRFIVDRQTSAEYRQHLGIVNLIRNDFQKLSDLLVETEDEAKSRDQVTHSNGLPRIDRIILYVDDLDRCPENRVVQVLQAVHLLLAFPLFVVVVGVDSRWLLLSLEDHYAALRGRRRNSGKSPNQGERDEWSTTPQNYLEKIFQIPFTLRPMAPAGFGRLVRSLLPVRPEMAYEPSEVASEEGIATLADISVSEISSSSVRTSKGEATEEGASTCAAGVSPEPELSLLMPLNPESLAVEVWELEFIERLNALVSSPRLLKRLTNLYRFVRARQDGPSLLAFTGTRDAPGEFQIVALLLASLVGFPREATRLFREVLAESDSNRDFWQLIEASDPSGGLTSPLMEHSRSLNDSLTDARLRRAFRHDASVKGFAKWIPEVARFSFESGRILSSNAVRRDTHRPDT